jgi:hypothetical protein
MIEDMTVRNFVLKTQTDYIRRVKNFAVFLGRSPDTASRKDVRRYLLHLASSGTGVSTLNQSAATLRFFFRVTLGRHDIVAHTTFIRPPQTNPLRDRRTDGAILTAISCLGASRTPLARKRRWHHHAGVRKPAQCRHSRDSLN